MIHKIALPKKSVHTEKDLLLLSAGGSQAAFTELYNLNKDRLYSFVLSLTKSEEQALDVVHDVFMRLWINRAQLVNIENFCSYIYRSAQNQILNSFKRAMNEAAILSLINPDVSQNNVEENLNYKVLEERLAAIIEKLPPQQRLVYTLSREQGLRHEDIAKQLLISPSTVKNHMVQALKTIKAILKNDLKTDHIILIGLLLKSLIFYYEDL